MPGDAADELAGVRASIDQGSAGMEEFARAVVRVHKILRDGGVPDQAAVTMALGYWQLILNGVHQASLAKASE